MCSLVAQLIREQGQKSVSLYVDLGAVKGKIIVISSGHMRDAKMSALVLALQRFCLICLAGTSGLT